MTPEERAAIEANIRKIVAGGGTEADVLAYLKVEGFGSRDEWLAAIAAPTPGPTEQPPNPTLSPNVGGALDLLRSMVLPFTAGINKAAGDTRQAEQLAELRARAPDATADALTVSSLLIGGGVGRGVLGALGRPTQAARARAIADVERRFMQSQLPPQYGLPVPIGGGTVPAATAKAGSRVGRTALDLFRNKYLRGGLSAELLRRAFDR